MRVFGISMAKRKKKISGKVGIGSIFAEDEKPAGDLSSAAVKIFSFSTFLYLLAVAAYLGLKTVMKFSVPDEVFGLPVIWWSRGAQVAIFAIALTFSTRLFLVRPVNKIKETIFDVGRGDFLARAEVSGRDEIGTLATYFNRMLDKLTELNAEKMKTEYELLLAREELKYKGRLEKRGKDLRKTNRALESLVRDFALLYEIGQDVNSTIEMGELYRVIQETISKSLNLQKFAILIVDEKHEFLNVKAAYGFENEEMIYDISFRIGEGISGEAALKGELIYVPDVESEARFLHYRGESVEAGSFLSIPLRYRRDVLGVMNCSRSDKGAFSADDIRLLTLVANQIALAVENAQLYTKTHELAVRDELTGLYNRRHFQEVMQMEWKRATRFKRPLSLIMVDIDHFKEFNDTFGHLHGDGVLKLITTLLIKNLREVDMIARFGGEEFVVLLPDTDKEGARVVGEKLRRFVETQRFEDNHREIMPLTISAGISCFPADAHEMDDLVDHADVALYEAKDRGRNRIVAYTNTADFTQPARGITVDKLVS